jgi:hypothetical protein
MVNDLKHGTHARFMTIRSDGLSPDEGGTKESQSISEIMRVSQVESFTIYSEEAREVRRGLESRGLVEGAQQRGHAVWMLVLFTQCARSARIGSYPTVMEIGRPSK